MNQIYTDILIVGAGPAGASAGINLQRAGFDCLVLDKASFPREKLCGGLITELGIQELNHMEIDTSSNMFFKPQKVRFFDGKIEIFVYKSTAKYAVVDRFEFDNLLVNKYRNLGGKILQRERVVEIRKFKKEVVTSSGKLIEYKYLIGADGANSLVRKAINTVKIEQDLCIEEYMEKDKVLDYPADGINVVFNKIDKGFAWSFESEKKVAVGVGGLIKDKKTITDIYGELNSNSKSFKGAFVPYGKMPETQASHDIFLIGDAGGYVDPILGEGLAYAIQSGRKITEVIKRTDKLMAYNREFDDMRNIVKTGNKLQTFFFNKHVNKFSRYVFKRYGNLTKKAV